MAQAENETPAGGGQDSDPQHSYDEIGPIGSTVVPVLMGRSTWTEQDLRYREKNPERFAVVVVQWAALLLGARGPRDLEEHQRNCALGHLLTEWKRIEDPSKQARAWRLGHGDELPLAIRMMLQKPRGRGPEQGR